MSAIAEREILLERRQYTPEQEALWNRLTLAQKFAARSLSQFGYDLAFIRGHRDGNLAVFCCDNHVATIDIHGEINSNPAIKLRQNQ
jgi:hypothetical protein